MCVFRAFGPPFRAALHQSGTRFVLTTVATTTAKASQALRGGRHLSGVQEQLPHADAPLAPSWARAVRDGLLQPQPADVVASANEAGRADRDFSGAACCNLSRRTSLPPPRRPTGRTSCAILHTGPPLVGAGCPRRLAASSAGGRRCLRHRGQPGGPNCSRGNRRPGRLRCGLHASVPLVPSAPTLLHFGWL